MNNNNFLMDGYNRVFEGGPGSGPQGDGEEGGSGGSGGGSAGGGGGSAAAPASSLGLMSRMGTAVKNAVMGTPEARANKQLANNYTNARDEHDEALAMHEDVNHPVVQAAKAEMDKHYAAMTTGAVKRVNFGS